MRKSTFIGNLVAWLVVGVACVAFLVWYNTTDAEVVLEATESVPVQVGMVLASPLLLFAIGALLGLLLVRLKRILLGRGARRACRVVAVLALALVLVAALPAVVPAAAESLLFAAVIVVYVTMAAPVLLIILGFVYGLGCAGVDPDKRGPFAKYLPDDDLE